MAEPVLERAAICSGVCPSIMRTLVRAPWSSSVSRQD